MLKRVLNRLLITLFICVALQGLAFGDEVEVVIKGEDSGKIIVDDAEFKFKVDFSKVNVDHIKKSTHEKSYVLNIGTCEVYLWGDEKCPGGTNHKGQMFGGNHIGFDYGHDFPAKGYFHDTVLFGTVAKENTIIRDDKPANSKISITNSNVVNPTMFCNIVRQSSPYPGKVQIEIKVTTKGESVDPNLITTFYGYAPPTTTPEPTTTTSEPTTTPEPATTTQASSSTSSTSTPSVNSTVKPLCPQCEEGGLEAWLIGLIAAIIILALLAIVLCVVLFCCYRRMQKAKAQKVVKKDQSTVVSTVSTAPRPVVKETNLYGPDMMYFARDATPVDPNAKSQAANPTPGATPIQTPK